MRETFILMLAAAFGATAAHAELNISNKPTTHMRCRARACTAMAASANLNIGDLVARLNDHDLTVSTGTAATDIRVADALSWAASKKLVFDAQHGAIKIEAPMINEGDGPLWFNREEMTCSGKGRLVFWNTKSGFRVNSVKVHLSASIADMAKSAPHTSRISLANDYDAGPDGVYSQSPVHLSADFDGLCNTISNLKIRGHGNLGLFETPVVAEVLNLRLKNISVSSDATTSGAWVGGIVGLTNGLLANVTVTGHVSGSTTATVGLLAGVSNWTIMGARTSGSVSGGGLGGFVGGLVGVFGGERQIVNSSSSANVTGDSGWYAGGLVGYQQSLAGIASSFATGTVIVGDDGYSGGAVGNSENTLANVYATGTVQGGVNSQVGGLVGRATSDIATSYASGAVASGSGNAVGGLIGAAGDDVALSDTYWDIETSGQSHGVGSDTGATGVTGLTTAQFQSGLPAGFDPAVWGQAPSINGGFPYLLAVKP